MQVTLWNEAEQPDKRKSQRLLLFFPVWCERRGNKTQLFPILFDKCHTKRKGIFCGLTWRWHPFVSFLCRAPPYLRPRILSRRTMVVRAAVIVLWSCAVLANCDLVHWMGAHSGMWESMSVPECSSAHKYIHHVTRNTSYIALLHRTDHNTHLKTYLQACELLCVSFICAFNLKPKALWMCVWEWVLCGVCVCTS